MIISIMGSGTGIASIPYMVTLPGGMQWPSLGLGTWRMGESSGRRSAEVAAVRSALEMGYRLIDTAEMYGDGGAEEVMGAALSEAFRTSAVSREDVVVVSKVHPHNASAAGVLAACERSLKRLRLDSIDTYLLHWRGAVPIAETVAAFESLRVSGRIRHWGVSNFDLDDMRELVSVDGGSECVTNQIYYSLTTRGPAYDLLPWQHAKGIVTMAYSPTDQGALCKSSALQKLAGRMGASPAQIALAWLIAQPGVMTIPKAVGLAHLADNFAAQALELSVEHLAELDASFPPPSRKQPLAMR